MSSEPSNTDCRAGLASSSTTTTTRRTAAAARTDSDDGYPSSDDDLSESDLRVLNSGFTPSREFALFPSHPQSVPNDPTDHHLEDGIGNADQDDDDDDDNTPLRHRDSRSRYQGQQHPTYHPPPRQSHAYRNPRPQPRPLIDYIKNEWREASLNPTHSQVYDDRYDPSVCLQMCCAPRLKRVWLVSFAVFFLLYCNWKFWAGPKLNERFELRESAIQRLNNAEGWFGSNLRPEFKDLIHIETLDEALLPQIDEAGSGRRLIFIGDVHGCIDERKVPSLWCRQQ